MKKGIIRYVLERDLTKADAKHVIIEREENPCGNPITNNDNLFYLHSNIPREFCGNESQKDYPGLPVVEEDAFVFPVAAYIHGRIALSLGNGSHFPDQQWDVTRKAAWIWTDKERFCQLCGEKNWMHVFDEKSKTWRPAKDRDEFESYLREQAEGLLEEWQKWSDGEVYGYRTEKSCVPYKRLYPDGHTEDEVAWEDGEDSCWGFIVDKPDDIDFPRGDGWEVFDDSGDFVGDEYEIPEFVVTRTSPDGTRYYLSMYTKNCNGMYNAVWTSSLNDAITFSSWWEVQSAAQDVIDKGEYNVHKNCIEKDKLKEA